jgi:putative endopeptidase
MGAHEVNAYYSPSNNEIVFPAGILQPPFFSEYYHAAVNFGSIGTVIGHEITHAFDDAGSKYDANGNLKNWWAPEDFIKYNQKTKIIKDIFAGFKLGEDFVNGELTLGENIADIGGLTISLEAFKKFLEKNPSENKLIDGQKPLEKFFISYASLWKVKSRPEDDKIRLMTDPHSPAIFRVNGVVNQIDDFYTTFKIEPNDKMFISSAKRAKIW